MSASLPNDAAARSGSASSPGSRPGCRRRRLTRFLVAVVLLWAFGLAVAGGAAATTTPARAATHGYDLPEQAARAVPGASGDVGARSIEVRPAHAFALAAEAGTAARGVPRAVSGGAPNLADLPANARATGSFNEIARRLGKNHGIDRGTASQRLHKIKAAEGRGPADNVIFELTGNVYDPTTGAYLGSLTQGGARRVGRG
jgi:hypothetical protein